MKTSFRGLLFGVCSLWVIAASANDTLTRAQVYSFSVGDTFEYQYSFGSTNFCPIASGSGYSIEVIQDMTYSIGGDTLYITRERIWATVATEDFIPSTSEYEVLQNISSPWVQVTLDSNSNYSGRTMNRVKQIFLGGGTTDVFVEGLGKVSHHGSGEGFPGCNTFREFHLIYYSKQNESWGTFVDFLTGLSTIRNPQFEINISPNPATTSLTIQSENNFPPQTTLQLFDITGRIILQQELNDKTNRIDVSALSRGMYLYNVIGEKQKLGAGKVIIE